MNFWIQEACLVAISEIMLSPVKLEELSIWTESTLVSLLASIAMPQS